jgi:hypothetical protein
MMQFGPNDDVLAKFSASKLNPHANLRNRLAEGYSSRVVQIARFVSHHPACSIVCIDELPGLIDVASGPALRGAGFARL